MKFREVVFFSRTFFSLKTPELTLEYTIKESASTSALIPSSSLPRPPTRRVAFNLLGFLVVASHKRAFISSLSFLNNKQKLYYNACCSHLTCVFFFLTFFTVFVSLKYLSLLVLRSNKSCVSREGNANTNGRIRAVVARFGVLLLSLESLAECLSVCVSYSFAF
jgi:hypothetical protein